MKQDLTHNCLLQTEIVEEFSFISLNGSDFYLYQRRIFRKAVLRIEPSLHLNHVYKTQSIHPRTTRSTQLTPNPTKTPRRRATLIIRRHQITARARVTQCGQPMFIIGWVCYIVTSPIADDSRNVKRCAWTVTQGLTKCCVRRGDTWVAEDAGEIGCASRRDKCVVAGFRGEDA